ncbi:hypothetical protein HDU96_007859 [Phlyctochytrium bullatum]|nr:hypothetical protein HDU96_007859 [Phlyctochytrium bullatum]
MSLRQFDETFSVEDLQELKSLLSQAKRPRVQKYLQAAVDASPQPEDFAPAAETTSAPQPVETKPSAPSSVVAPFFRTITQYAWSESSKSVSIYVTLPNSLQKITDSLVPDLKCTKSSVELDLPESEKLVHRFKIQALEGEILPEQCSVKIKNDKAVITLKKVKTGDWNSLPKKKKDNSLDKGLDKDGEPQDAIMNLMKKMYDEGDDEMKRMINKTWAESQQKRGGGMGGGIPKLDDMDFDV